MLHYYWLIFLKHANLLVKTTAVVKNSLMNFHLDLLKLKNE